MELLAEDDVRSDSDAQGGEPISTKVETAVDEPDYYEPTDRSLMDRVRGWFGR